jgi:hypothetical protein
LPFPLRQFVEKTSACGIGECFEDAVNIH